jgi:hypothetical protein
LDTFRDKYPDFQLEDELDIEGGEMSCGATPTAGAGKISNILPISNIFLMATSSRSATSDGPYLQQAQASPRRAQGGRTGQTRVREGFSDQGLIWKAKISI